MREYLRHKESMVFETNDGNEWMVVFNGERAILYKMEKIDYGGDKIARYCAGFLVTSTDYFEFLNDRSGMMVNFALQLLSIASSTK